MSLAESSYRKFTFFDKIAVSDPKDAKENIRLKYKNDFWANNANHALFGSSNGTILHMSRNLNYQLWKSFSHRLFAFQLSPNNILASIGLDEAKESILLLKIWDLSRWERSLPLCKCVSRVNLTKKNLASPAFAVAINSTHSLLAIGFSDSSVFFCTGDFARDKASVPRFKSLREGANALGSGELVGLAVATSSRKYDAETSIIFVITKASVTSYIIIGGSWKSTVPHNDKGCEPHCWYLLPEKNQLVVAGREVVSFYDTDSILETGSASGACQALERGAEKLQLVARRYHVALLTHRKIINSEASSITLSVHDVEFRFAAYLSSTQPCRLFTLADEIYILEDNGALFRLCERPLNTNLEFLLKKNLFDIAIGMSRRYKSTESHNIYKEYGDYLYSRGDFDNSIRQYMLTIGHIEPSYVILKFLDGARIEQLCSYLELIHQKGIAVEQHTSLLIGAYVKMGAQQKIVDFVKNSANSKVLDLRSAVKILRSSKFNEIAANLAKQYNCPDLYLSILIDDFKDYTKALQYIEQLNPAEICDYLESYANVLMENCEVDVVKILSKIVFLEGTDLKMLMKIVLRKPECLQIIFSGNLSKLRKIADVSIRNTILEQHLRHLSLTKPKSKAVLEEERKTIFSLIDFDNFKEALHLAQVYKYPPLVIYVLKKQDKMEDMLRYLLKEGDINDVVEYCGEDALKSMWIELITFVSSRKNIDSQYLDSLLQRATETNFVHPLAILEILSRNESFKMGDVHAYILKWLKKQTELIADKEVEIKLREDKIMEMANMADDLEHNIQVFQTSKCSACDTSLSVPALHFLCKHAYHLHCYEEYNTTDQIMQCPFCAFANRKEQSVSRDCGSPSTQKISDLDLSTTQRPITHQQFRKELENCTDAIDLISKYISRGLFDT